MDTSNTPAQVRHLSLLKLWALLEEIGYDPARYALSQVESLRQAISKADYDGPITRDEIAVERLRQCEICVVEKRERRRQRMQAKPSLHDNAPDGNEK